MRILCWIPKVKNTLRVCNTYFFSTALVVAPTPLSVVVVVVVVVVIRASSVLFNAIVLSPVRPSSAQTEHVLKSWEVIHSMEASQ
jgi:ERCC4-related helicase